MQGEIEVEEPQEGEGEEEEHSASPRNVGHNIYILAHQVSHELRVDKTLFTNDFNRSCETAAWIRTLQPHRKQTEH